MMFLRFRLLLLVACCLYGQTLLAQESSGGTGGTGGSGSSGGTTSGGGTGSSSTGGSGASSAFGSPSTPSVPTNPFAPSTPSTPSTPGSNAPSFRTGESAPGTGEQPGTTPGAASSFGSEQGGAGTGVARTPPASFTVPGLYGRSQQQFVVGEGRLARPRFRFTGKVSMGYDDNVFQTPTHPQSVPDQKVAILVQPEIPTTTQLVLVPSGDPNVPATAQMVEIPGQKAKFRFEKIPGTPAPERIGSFVTRSSLGWDIQLASRRNLFTFDVDGGASYYWDRPGKKYEYNGSLSLIYLRKITGRAQFTMSVDASYQNQPNFAQINTPTSNNRGAYLTTNAKADLSYRLTPRFSTVTSVAYSSLYSAEQSQRAGDYRETTFGTELRYLFSPRLTLLGELRYSSSLHAENSAQDFHTYFALVGGELTLTRRFTASLRVGEAVQTFTEDGDRSSSPYVEATLDYRLARGTTIQWNARYGFEEPGAADTELIVARSGLALTQIFSPRLQGSLALNLVRQQNTQTSEVTVQEPTSSETTVDATGAVVPAGPTKSVKKSVTTETVQNTIDATLGFHYTLSRHWAFNLSYTYTMLMGDDESGDYYRQQIFLGAEFQF